MNQVAHVPYHDLPDRTYVLSRPDDRDEDEADERVRLLGDEVAALPWPARQRILHRLRERDDLR